MLYKLMLKDVNWAGRSKDYGKLDWVNKDEMLRVMVEMAGDYDNDSILDVGTGTGKVLMALHNKNPDILYFGIDTSVEMVNNLKKLNGFNVRMMDMEDMMHISDKGFDLVTARMVLHHATDINKAMSEIHRVLKPEGKLIVCEGNPPSKECLPFYNVMFVYKEERLTFLLDDLVNLLLNNGFKDVCSRTVILRDMSLNNWLDNSDTKLEDSEIIKRMHLNCSRAVRKAYNMRFVDGDVLMDWKFSVVSGIKI